MFAAGPYAAGPWASVPGVSRNYAEGTGYMSTAVTVAGKGTLVKQGTGAMRTNFSINGISQKILAGVGVMSISFDIWPKATILLAGQGVMSTGLTFQGIGAIYEFPYIPTDNRVVKVGLWLYEWRQELGKWKPLMKAPEVWPPI